MAVAKPPRPTIKVYHGDEPVVWRWLIPVLIGMFLILGLTAYFLLKPLFDGAPSPLSRAQYQDLTSELEVLKEENRSLKNQLALANRSKEIDRQASQELVSALAEREDELAELKEELNFYMSMVSSEGEGGFSEIKIRSFDIVKSDRKGRYIFRLVLSRTELGGKPTKGNVELRIQGKRGKEEVILGWDDIAAEADWKPEFGFLNFQRLEGTLQFPADFVPENVLVKIMPSKGKGESIQQSFSWSAVLKGEKA
ncbi:MAG: DUF6776 family protein [Thiotrichales bacterium]